MPPPRAPVAPEVGNGKVALYSFARLVGGTRAFWGLGLLVPTQALSRDAGLAVRVRPGKRIESGKMRPSIFGLLGNRVPARLCPFRASWAVRTELVAFPARPSLQPRAHITS